MKISQSLTWGFLAFALLVSCGGNTTDKTTATPTSTTASSTATGGRLTPDGQPWPIAPNGQPFPAQPDGKPFPAQPDGSPFPAQPDGTPFPAQADGRPFPALADGRPVPAGPNGAPLPVGPDGLPLPPATPAKPLTAQERAALAAEAARLAQEKADKAKKAFQSFGLSNPAVPGVIQGSNVTISVGFKTNLANLVPVFKFDGKQVSVGGQVQTSGVSAQNFNAPVTYDIEAQDGSHATWTVTVVRGINPKRLASFWFKELPDFKATLSEPDHSISLTLPFGTNLKALTAVFSSTTDLVEVGGTTQASNQTKNDFSGPVVYTVVDDEGKHQNWTVKVDIIAANKDATLNRLELPGLKLETAFAPTVKSYTVHIPVARKTVSFLVTPQFAKAKVEVIINDGQPKPLPSGTESTAFPIRDGDNNFFIRVTAEDVKVTQFYIVVAKRE